MKKNIVTEYTEMSAFSACPKECDHHLIFGSGLRKLAEEDGLFIPLTNKEHNMGHNTEKIHGNQAAEKLSKMLGQTVWESQYLADALEQITGENDYRDKARRAFRNRYGISYL